MSFDPIKSSLDDATIVQHPFIKPEYCQADLAVMRHMARQLVETYDDPLAGKFRIELGPIERSDSEGRAFKIYYIQPERLFKLKNLTAVGFFGQKRSTADIQPLVEAGVQFEREFRNHPGLLSLSTVTMSNGDFGNLVLFTDPQAKDDWNFCEMHNTLVAELSPPYYHSVRLHNGCFPDGLAAPEKLQPLSVKYIDYDSDPHWRKIRMY